MVRAPVRRYRAAFGRCNMDPARWRQPSLWVAIIVLWP